MENAPPVISSVEPESARPVARWRWVVHLVLVTAYLLVVAFIGLGREQTHQPALSHTTSGLIKVCLFELASFGIVLGIAWFASRATVDDLRLRWRGNVIPVLLGVAYSIGLRVAIGIVSLAVALVFVVTHGASLDKIQDFAQSNRPTVENAVDVNALRDNPAYLWLTLTLVSFGVAGLREELWRSSFIAGMRGVWPRQFSSTAGQAGAVVISAIIFGIGHTALGGLMIGMATLLGLGLGFIMVFHRSIWPAVLAHGFFDATSMALIPFALDVMKSLPKH